MGCNDRKSPTKGDSLAQVIAEFLDQSESYSGDEISRFQNLPIESAIKTATRARDQSGKLFIHQWNLFNHPEVPEQAESILLRCIAEIDSCKEFDALHELVKSKLQIKWANELYWYDTAFRIGISKGIYPKKVYLHAGTRKGAIDLGIYEKGKEILAMSDLIKKYPEFAKLEPHQIEDFLCIMWKKRALPKFNRY